MAALLPVLIAFQAGVPPALAWTWPVDGPVLRPFEFGDDPYAAGQHRGLDVGADSGDPVRAPVSGVVSFAGSVPGGGRSLTLQTSDGLSVTLVHLGGIAVARTVRVEEGAVVGRVGPSGDAEHPVPYVHLGVRRTSEADGYLDPLGFLPPRAPAKAPAATVPAAAPASAPEPEPAPATKAGPAVSAAAAPETPYASASPSRNGQPAHGDHVMTRSERPEVVPGRAPRAAGTVTASDAAPALPRGDSPALSTTRRTVPGSLELPAPEPSASAAPNGLDRPAQRAGSLAVPDRVVLLVAGLCLAVLVPVAIVVGRLRGAGGSSPETTSASSLVPKPAAACELVTLSSQPSARSPRAASPRCGSRGGPHRSRRLGTKLVAAS
jgi:hypothetical protein